MNKLKTIFQKKPQKLKPLRVNSFDYIVPIPRRLKKKGCSAVKINISLRDKEYQYIPGTYVTSNMQFSSDELRMIADELDRLNER